MELREMNIATAEETAELLPSKNNRDESYFIEYALQKEIINRNRIVPSRRLLSQTGVINQQTDGNSTNSNLPKDFPVITFVHAGPNWPPSRKREEARALENLRKRVGQSKLYKKLPPMINPLSLSPSSSSSSSSASSTTGQQNYEEKQQLDSRPKLLKKILSNRPMSICHDISDLETDWRDSEFITECLCWHNVYRQRHNAPTLTLSPELCEYAQTWANHLAHTNTFYYRNDRKIGQNLYCRPGGRPLPSDVTGQDVSSYWYSAVKQYDFYSELDFLHTNVNAGHFTQLIWASSKLFGVGKARSRSGKIIVVANYQPIGNVAGQFNKNIQPPLPDCANMPNPPPPRIRQYNKQNSSDMSTKSSNSSMSTQ